MNSIITEILSRFLGDFKNHNESNGQIAFNCPACAEEKGMYEGDNKFKLAINYKRNMFRCWVCAYDNNMKGSVTNLIQRFGNKTILKEYLAVAPTSVELLKRVNYVKLPEGYKELSKSSNKDYLYTKAMTYLKSRGVSDEMIKQYNIGFTTTGKYRNRIILPSYDSMGVLNFFTSRAWDKWVSPKYLNPDADKLGLIFNENIINWDATIYLVEGPMDHLVIPNSIPILGKVLPNHLRSEIFRKAKSNVVLVLDEDAYDASIDIYKSLNCGDLYGKILMCKMNVGDDPSSIFKDYGSEGIIKALRTSSRLDEWDLY